MINRQDMSLTIAFCAAIGAHSILVRLAADEYSRDAGTLITEAGRSPVAMQLLSERDRLRIGASDGTGDAIMSSPGELPQLALKANQNQPFLSRDPAGFGPVGNEPSQSVFPQRPTESRSAAPEAPSAPFGVAPADVPTPVTRSRPGNGPTPAPKAPITDSAVASINENPALPAPSVRASPAPSADPAPMSDSEIDAFSKTSSAQFRPGATSVQFGRKTKLTRPKITVSGEFDMISLASPRVVLEIRTNTTGNVYDVRLIRGSGSKDLDLACQRAAYNWWFEPPKNTEGIARADVFPFIVSFH